MGSETERYWSNWLAAGAYSQHTEGKKLLWKESKWSWTTNAMITVTDALLHKLGLLFLPNVLQLQ